MVWKFAYCPECLSVFEGEYENGEWSKECMFCPTAATVWYSNEINEEIETNLMWFIERGHLMIYRNNPYKFASRRGLHERQWP